MQLLYSLLMGFAGGGAAVLAGWKVLGDWLVAKAIEGERARYGKEIEELKAKYQQELERYRAELNRSILVTRAQFETEFESYKRVFEGLGEVRLAISGTRPMMGVSRPGETKEDRLKALWERLNVLAEAHDKTVKILEYVSPFITQGIYLKIEECLIAARGEILDIRTAGEETFSFGWFEEGQKRLDQFFKAYGPVTNAIRERIASLAIIPRS